MDDRNDYGKPLYEILLEPENYSILRLLNKEQRQQLEDQIIADQKELVKKL